MICEKCSGKMSKDGRCTLCGYVYTESDIKELSTPSKNSYTEKSLRLSFFVKLYMVFDSISLLFYCVHLFSDDYTTFQKVLILVIMASLIFDIVLLVYILKLKKWARTTFIALTVISGIFQLLTFSISLLFLAFKLLLLYFIFRKDWDNFE